MPNSEHCSELLPLHVLNGGKGCVAAQKEARSKKFQNQNVEY